MKEINGIMKAFKTQLQEGDIQIAYRYLFEILLSLSSSLKRHDLTKLEVGTVYHGYLDMSYVPITSELLKAYGLKIAIVFDYSNFEFQIWLSSKNRRIRGEFIDLMKSTGWKYYKSVNDDRNPNAIFEVKLTKRINFSDKEKLVNYISDESVKLISHVEGFITVNHKSLHLQ